MTHRHNNRPPSARSRQSQSCHDDAGTAAPSARAQSDGRRQLRLRQGQPLTLQRILPLHRRGRRNWPRQQALQRRDTP